MNVKSWIAGVALAFAPLCVVPVAAQDHTSLRDLEGVWEMQGYGIVLQISQDRVERYDTTDISCVRTHDWKLADVEDDIRDIERRGSGYRFVWSGITHYTVNPLPALPSRCQQFANESIRDPLLNFWVLWHAFKENYAFFEREQVDWNRVATQFRQGLSVSTTEQELMQRFLKMLTLLNDGHVMITDDPARKQWIRTREPDELLRRFIAETGITDQTESRAEFARIADRYVMEEVLKGKAQQAADNAFIWGWLGEGIGYLDVTTMMPRMNQVDEAMVRVLNDLGRARVLVVDARFNRGGKDSVALRIAGHLSAQRHLAFTKKAVSSDGHTEPEPIYVEPVGSTPFRGPILFLQSEKTASAGEIFALAMKVMPNVTLLGTHTHGALSDALEKRLPNGWAVRLSNEIYLAEDGEIYEGRGIPPELAIDTRGVETLQQRLQLDIDLALSEAQRLRKLN